MARPDRNAFPGEILSTARTFFATTKTYGGRRLLETDRNATLLVDVLRSCVAARKFQLLDFVVMPNHLHLLITVPGGMTIEKAIQLIKGRFSYRLKKEFGYPGEVWQASFSEVRADTKESIAGYREYIALNPVKAGLAESPEQYPYCYGYLAKRKAGKG
jgi:putative transposase